VRRQLHSTVIVAALHLTQVVDSAEGLHDECFPASVDEQAHDLELGPNALLSVLDQRLAPERKRYWRAEPTRELREAAWQPHRALVRESYRKDIAWP
jgi:hypothetical protein